MMLSGKVVVVTGASSGIGAAMVKELSKRGAIPILMARSEDKLGGIAAELAGEHGLYPLDVTSNKQVQDTMASVINRFGRIDVLINNAGYGVFDKLTDASVDEMSEMMNVNYMGTVRCIKAVLPAMLEARSGHIINIASLAGKIGSAKSSGYSATKHAVLGFTNSLRQELMGTGVKLSAINPGPIDTPFFDRADPSGQYIKNIKWFMLKPEKVVGTIIRTIERGTPEVNMPWVAGFGAKFAILFPRIFEKVAYRMLNKK
ncbi:SDR family NAD(P)-dependent oxidoreductase [Paenibacillus agricola]|uniref:SDR family oxidoreductase n=1 Tax=Paenibacillus agricola TaxID=2716264 RepID=A0ABX0J4D1_9BACL|nr:SDR family oxidoreductase [Paenibacillus agricola]NHN30280.1 SDR family oxidoreductase [Paenibacillus agricola]